MDNDVKFLTLGQNIREIRTSLNMTQDEFSEKINITSNFLSKVENGNVGISLDTVINICTLAKCPSATLFKGIIDFPTIGQYELLSKSDKLLIDNLITRLLNIE